MRVSQIIFLLVFIAIILSIDLFLYKWFKSIQTKFQKSLKIFSVTLFRISPVVFILTFILLPLLNRLTPPEEYMGNVHIVSGLFFLIYIPKLDLIGFIIIENIFLGIFKLYNLVARSSKLDLKNIKQKLSIINKIGILIATVVFFLIVYGIVYGKFDYKIREVEIKSKNIPESFDGKKIVHFTDIHLGGFWGHEEEVDKIAELINKQDPDLVVFTGDFVNNVANEAKPFLNSLRKINSKLGNFSILGNHDYGDYLKWESAESKKENLNRLISYQDSIGFYLLNNETIKIGIGKDTINIIGVENWGEPPFPQYGDLSKAIKNTDLSRFDILLSHDPTHWSAKVLKLKEIDLTLSGHTHGAQFGLELDGIRWSPVSIRYDHWGGLYENNNQKLYVSTGIGFIGFPGRVGMPPEIVVLKLVREQ